MVLIGTVLGVTVAFSLEITYRDIVSEVVDFADPRIVLGLLFGGVGYLIASTIAWEFQRWIDSTLPTLKMKDIFWGIIGLLAGLLLANLAMLPIFGLMFNEHINAFLAKDAMLSLVLSVFMIVLPLTLNLLLGYLGMVVFMSKQQELYAIFTNKLQPVASDASYGKILDSSAIIDGRILDLLPTSIVEGSLIVPQFVLNELQMLSDSADPMKRSKGKRGFEILEKLKEISPLPVELPFVDYQDTEQVDNKLIEYAIETGYKLVTNDFALNKLAHLQEVSVINMNEVSNALRPVVLSGETIVVKVVKKGKSGSQGVGFLNDGTMVVIEGASSMVGSDVTAVVENVQQSSVGRMVFSKVSKDTSN